MKSIVHVLCIALSIISSREALCQAYHIQGKVGTSEPRAKVFLVYVSGSSYHIDSGRVQAGVFNFQGRLATPQKASLILDHSGADLSSLNSAGPADVLELYLESGLITITSPDSLLRAVVTGGPLNKDFGRFKKQQQPLEQEMKKLISEAKTSPKQSEPQYQADIQSKFNEILSKNQVLVRTFVQANPSSQVSLDLLTVAFSSQGDNPDASTAFNALSSSLKETPQGKKLGAILAAAKLTAIGSQAPDFAQADTSGKLVKLSSLKGSYVLVDFWASWCKPCRMENPNVVAVYQKYKSRNFTIVGVSLDRTDDKASWLQAIRDDHLAWTQVSDLRFWANEAAVAYGVRSIPQNFLLDPQGKIIAKSLRGDDLNLKLAEVLK